MKRLSSAALSPPEIILSMMMTRMLWLRIIAIGAGILQALYYGIWLNDPVGTFWETMFTLTARLSRLSLADFLR